MPTRPSPFRSSRCARPSSRDTTRSLSSRTRKARSTAVIDQAFAAGIVVVTQDSPAEFRQRYQRWRQRRPVRWNQGRRAGRRHGRQRQRADGLRPPRQPRQRALRERGALGVRQLPRRQSRADAGGELELGDGQVDDASVSRDPPGSEDRWRLGFLRDGDPCHSGVQDSRRPGSGGCKWQSRQGIPRLLAS